MSRNSPNNSYIIDQQRVYLSRLQELQPNKPVRAQRPKNGDMNLPGKCWVEWQKTFTTASLLTCSILSNELAIDPDVKDWALLNTEHLCSVKR